MRTSIDSYKSRAGRLDLEDIDFDDFSDVPLSAEGLRCLRYMNDIERHTVCYLRELLLTPAHHDPDVTAFLSCWAFEEFWHGEAIGAILDAHDASGHGTVQLPQAAGRRASGSLGTVAKFGFTTVFGRAFVPVHMAWGAVNEWTTQAAYARLAAIEKHPTLSEILRRIMKQEGRHIDFYASEATRRLVASPRAQELTRFALRHFWAPVGSGVKPRSEVAFLCRHLFGGGAGRALADRIDRRVDGLPGQQGLRLLGTAVARLSAPGRPHGN